MIGGAHNCIIKVEIGNYLEFGIIWSIVLNNFSLIDEHLGQWNNVNLMSFVFNIKATNSTKSVTSGDLVSSCFTLVFVCNYLFWVSLTLLGRRCITVFKKMYFSLVPVRFTKKPHPVKIEEGRNATLICKASGFPEPVISWTASSTRGRMLSETSVKGRLTITNATLKHNDRYTCTAKNDVNEVKAFAHVSVLPKLKFLVPPVAHIKSYIGGKISLLCQATSGTVTWSKQSASMPKAYKILRNGTLKINVTSFHDSGLYTCVAKSEVATINSSSVLAVHARSCSELKLAGYNRSGVFDVKPGKDSPTFKVRCNMTDKGGVGVSFVSHNSEQRTVVKGYISPGSYIKNVIYDGITLAQITHLVQASTQCEQFIKYECHHSVLLWGGVRYGWWVSRDGEKMTYWGGASPKTDMCACGMNDSCATGGACNCDANDMTWREDSGLLTDKSKLPVTQLRFGDTGDPRVEMGFHTLGKLKCYGIA